HAMMQLGEKKVELQNTVKENEEIKSLLEERESLIGSLIRSNKTATTGALSASIAHELNQPLGASNLNIQFLKMKLEKGELNSQLQKELFDALQADNNRATDIVRSLRSIFTDEKLEAECTNLTALTESILVIVKPELKAKNIALLIDMPPELKAPVRKTEIQQVTLNLLNNAIQSLDTSNRADKKITIEGERGVDGVKICISDNGVGVAKAIQGDLFTIINSGKKTGMGLGLWLCQHIVGRHGGSIWHEDIPDGGARFCFKLPLSTF
ncbi:MAG: HAMP domain-containing sensor histidine kinase, partial [Polynucleobacter sp.]|nr:HAMP domain-containing sensor histidine kinase [Polynucleobacter sp.]